MKGICIFLLKNLHFEKFDGVNSKHSHSFFKLLPEITQIMRFQTRLAYFAAGPLD